MTPLQAIAATKFVNGDGISAHRMTTIMSDYLLNPLTVAIKNAIDSVSYIDTDGSTVVYPLLNAAQSFPEASGIVRVGDRVTAGEGLDLPGFESTDDIKVAVVGYANHILCNGDLGKFASLVDKVSGLMTAVGDVTATIDKAATMKFSDFGPGVANYGDAINMGMGPATAGIAESMRTANNGQLPVIPGVPATESASVGAVILAQGEVSGDSASPNYGTARGIYDAVLAVDFKLLVPIWDAYFENGITYTAGVAGTSSTYRDRYTFQVSTGLTQADFDALMTDLSTRSATDLLSDDEKLRAEAQVVSDWVDAQRRKGLEVFRTKISKGPITVLATPKKFAASTQPAVSEILNSSINNETATAAAINSIPLADAKKIFAALKCKIQIEKLEKYTDVLDLAKCAAAMPPPLTDKSAPMSVKTTAAAPIENLITGKLVPQSLDVTQDLSTPALATEPTVAVGAVHSASAIGSKALGIVNNIKASLSSLIPTDLVGAINKTGQALIASNMQAVGNSFGQVKGFENLRDTKSLGNMLRSIETSLPVSRGLAGSATQQVDVSAEDIEEARKLKSNAADVAAGKPSSEWNVTPEQYVRNSKLGKALTPTFLNSFTQVMPPEIKTQLQEAVGVGTAAGGSYSLLDFLGSAVGENKQVENWQKISQSCSTLWAQYEAELSPLITDMIANADSLYDYSQFTNLLDTMYNTTVGQEVVTAYDDSINKIQAEYDRLVTVAGVDFALLQSGDLTSKLNLSKKLAQHAHKLDSGHAVIFQAAADPGTVGGQAMLGVMVEARNTKLLQNIGFSPVNSISKPTKTAVSEEDTTEAAKINAKSGDADGITPQQVANNRALNNTLSGLFGVK
tara:strand:+ start:26823 stop:29384 length:2562 start_codon:yes stop_codon:yes gene_type:complete